MPILRFPSEGDVMKTDQIMQNMGFPPDDNSLTVAELRKVVARQVSEGMTHRSYGTWAPGVHSNETRAKAFLAVEWEMQHNHCTEVKCFDGFIRRGFNTKTMRRTIRVKWRYFFPWLGDFWRRAETRLRIWRDDRRGVRNPWS